MGHCTTHQTFHKSLGDTQDERASAIVDRLKHKSGLDLLLRLFVLNLGGLGVRTQHMYRPKLDGFQQATRGRRVPRSSAARSHQRRLVRDAMQPQRQLIAV